jgi:AraC-like DNA-binding protein
MNRFFDYLPVCEAELTWGLYVTGLGKGLFLPGSDYPPRDHPKLYDFDFTQGRTLPEYQIIYISEGRGEFRSGPTGTVDITSGSVIFLFPDIWHTYRPEQSIGWHEYWMSFNGSYIYELCRRGLFDPKQAVQFPSDSRRIAQSFERLLSSVQESPQVNSMLFSAMAFEILALVAMENQNSECEPSRSEMSPFIREALRVIWGWSYRELSVVDVATAVGLSRRTLERYFREARGCSILDEILHCRLVRAQRLLEGTRMPIKRVAWAAGFSTPERMAKVFQRMTGLSPSQYRKKNRR